MFFSVITKNLNWEILTKNLLTFKRWNGVKDKKILMEVHRKIRFLGGGGEGFTKNLYIGGDCQKKGGFGSLQI